MFLVFDIGGTNMRVGVSPDGEGLSNIQSISTPDRFEEGIKAFKDLADKVISGQKMNSAAGGITGPLNKSKSTTLNPPHQPDWKEKPIKEELERILGVNVFLENDTALAALGETIIGAGKGKEIVVYLTISTGVGGARVVNGKIDANSLGFEPGHQIIAIDGEPCNCGGKGHLESYASGSGLERKYQMKAQDIKDEKVWDQVARYLAIGLNNTIVHWSPDMVILGGSVMRSLSLETVIQYLKETVTIFPNLPEITQVSLGDEVGLYGALEYLKQQKNLSIY